MPRRKWFKKKVTAGLKRQKELSWSYLRKNQPRLLSAAEKRFGSLRKAVESLGLDYNEFSKRKPLTKKWVIKEIHAFVASGDVLSTLYTIHSNLMRKSKRLFGSMRKAFKAAGYRYKELKRTPGHASRWPERHDLLREIRNLPTIHHENVHRN